mmetsp:Transcript_61446/g.139091  ORF Transcript_61446/g.139091 Transcript_61446/m.139091 type:complete len:502 (-) Transcript_61446:292-1797(-)
MYRGAPTTPYGSRGAATPRSVQKQSNFSFPLLPVKDILTCLGELYFTISEEELTHCEKHALTIRRLFEALLEVLAGTRKEEINMPVFSAHQNIAYPQLHEDSIPELAFWRKISHLMEVCGVTDFTREDLTRPDPKRLRKQLSGLINFAKFREERMDMYNRVTVERDEHLDRLATLEEQNSGLTQQLDELRNKNRDQREEIRRLDEATAEAAAKVNAKNEEQSSLRHKSAELKEQNNEIKEKLSEFSLEHSGYVAETKKLQSQVVHSPERVRREMHESQRALVSERRDGEAAEQAALAASQAAKVCEDGVAKVHEASKAVGEILDLSNKCIEVSSQIKTREAAISANRKDASEVAERGAELERMNARLDEKLKHVEGSAEAKAQAAALASEELRAKLAEQRRKKKLTESMLSEEGRSAESLASKVAEEEQLHVAKMAALMAAWRRLETSVRGHQKGLLEACNQPTRQTSGAADDDELPVAPLGGYEAYPPPMPSGAYPMSAC